MQAAARRDGRKARFRGELHRAKDPDLAAALRRGGGPIAFRVLTVKRKGAIELLKDEPSVAECGVGLSSLV